MCCMSYYLDELKLKIISLVVKISQTLGSVALFLEEFAP
jgi:hypothetical protein